MKPLISVIIPIYGVESYLKECVDSVIAQSYRNIEIILVDDGSPDRCGQICDEYKKQDERIIVIHKENGGLSSARNAGIDICKGEYISFIDSDDFVSPYFIELLLEAAIKYDSDVTTFSASRNFLDGEDTRVVFDDKVSSNSKELTVKESLELMFYQVVPSGAQHRLYKKHIFSNLRYPNGDLFEEMATVYKTYLLSKRTAIIYGRHYAYRIRKNSIVRMDFNERKMICIPVSQKTYKDIIAYDSSLNDAVSCRMFSFNYQIFLQVPTSDLNSQKKLWTEIKKYRSSVIKNKDSRVRKKNKYAAFITLFGMNLAHKIGNIALYKRIGV